MKKTTAYKPTTEAELRLLAKSMSGPAIAKHLGIPYYCIGNALSALGIKTSAAPKSSALDMGKVKRMQLIGMTGLEICRALGISTATLYSRMRAAGTSQKAARAAAGMEHALAQGNGAMSQSRGVNIDAVHQH